LAELAAYGRGVRTLRAQQSQHAKWGSFQRKLLPLNGFHYKSLVALFGFPIDFSDSLPGSEYPPGTGQTFNILTFRFLVLYLLKMIFNIINDAYGC
jgi:hypothetical protein